MEAGVSSAARADRPERMSPGERKARMLKYVWVLMFLAAPAAAEMRTAEPPPVWLKSVGCRIVSRDAGASANFIALKDVTIDTLSKDPVEHSFHTTISGGRRLGATVQHVFVQMPRERFNVAMTLDGKTHLRLNHIDLDIYLETIIDGRIYVLHCFRDNDERSIAHGESGSVRQQ